MRYSKMLLPTSKEVPAEAEVISHQLLLRGGFIRKLTAGVYSYLPLGLMALRKVTAIVREEMKRAGAQEILMPMVQPGDLWMESGRWQHYGPELLRFRDRNERECCLSPTQEEVATDLARRELLSYRQLPVNIYHIQTKYRDEMRPRFGLMRCREFIMKDAYSFDADDEGAARSYENMRVAYNRIFARLGLDYRMVEADSGSIGGSYSHEFMVLADAGEDTLVLCRDCSYAANVEKAMVAPVLASAAGVPLEELRKVATPGTKKVATVAEFLKVPPQQIIKTMIYQIERDGPEPREFVAALVRGDREVQTVKLKNLLGANEVNSLTEDQVWEFLRLPVGFIGPVNLPLRVVADSEVMAMVNAVAGANEKGFHYQGVNPERDFSVQVTGDLRQIAAGDRCPHCGGLLHFREGIEVGHIFKLGAKYSEAMNATFQDREGRQRPFIMGCYGIGVSRILAACIEQNHDRNGIIFPMPLAPVQVILLNLGLEDEALTSAAEELYQALLAAGVEVLFDDRDERPGAKFKDADLLGIPLRLTVGRTFKQEGLVELRERKSGETTLLPVDQVVAAVQARIRRELA